MGRASKKGRGASARGASARGASARERATRFDEEPLRGEPADYAFLDSGGGSKLERFGPVTLARPAAQALWGRRLGARDWSGAAARFERETEDRGRWRASGSALPSSWVVELGGLSLIARATSFGHTGLFPEHAAHWPWIEERCRRRPLRVLNLFAYTGGASLAAARGGAEVCHVDAARGTVDWARANARLSGLEERPIRWIVDDAAAFVSREARRGRTYHGLILDPPSYGRGRKGELWKIEDDLPPFLELCRGVLAEDADFVLASCHSRGFSPLVLANLLEEMMAGRGGAMERGENALEAAGARPLPSGCYARWSAGGAGDGA